MQYRERLYTCVFCLLLLTGCSKGYHQFTSNYPFPAQLNRPDYADLDYWAAHPAKKDPSDSVPRALRNTYLPDTTVDVFFIHPTTYTDAQKPFGWNAPINNAELAAKTDYSTILFQASVFNNAGRVFSPRYRQANLEAYFPKTSADTLSAMAAFDTAYTDIKQAFQYYLLHENKGRPIIIAAHSQGTTQGKRLLQEMFDPQPLLQQLVVAYLIGIPVETTLLSSIPPCDSAKQVACVCSWRTFKEGYQPDYVVKEPFKAIVTNPLTWDKTLPDATRQINKGGIVTNFNRPVKKVAAAHVYGNVLWTPKPRFFGNIFFTTPNYHVGDLNLYYLSIRENVAARVTAYRKK